MDALASKEIEQQLSALNDWQFTDNQIVKSFKFKNFKEALGFIVRMGFEAEKLNHHPELKNVYNKVDIALTTHDAGNRVTQKDFSLAKAIDKIY